MSRKNQPNIISEDLTYKPIHKHSEEFVRQCFERNGYKGTEEQRLSKGMTQPEYTTWLMSPSEIQGQTNSEAQERRDGKKVLGNKRTFDYSDEDVRLRNLMRWHRRLFYY